MAKKRGHGEGTIYRRKDGRWIAQITVDYDPKTGKTRRVTLYGKTRQQVQAKLDELRRQLQEGLFVEPNKITLGQWLDRWMRVYQKPKVAPTTYEMRQRLIQRHILPALGDVPLVKLRPSDLQELYTAKLDAGLSSQTVRHIHNILNPALKQAMREGLIARNVAQAVSPPKLVRTQEMRPLTREEVRQFLTAIRGDRLFAAFFLEMATGLRRGELLGLKWEDLDLTKGTLQVRRSLVRIRQDDGRSKLVFREPKTAKSRRLIPLPEEAVKVLKEHRRRQAEERLRLGSLYQDHGLVFCTEDGRPIGPRNFIRRCTALLRKAGVEHTRFHNLRHTFATLLLEMDEHPKVVQEILGHSRITQTLDTYSHILPGLKERAAAKMNDILKTIPKQEKDAN